MDIEEIKERLQGKYVEPLVDNSNLKDGWQRINTCGYMVGNPAIEEALLWIINKLEETDQEEEYDGDGFVSCDECGNCLGHDGDTHDGSCSWLGVTVEEYMNKRDVFEEPA